MSRRKEERHVAGQRVSISELAAKAYGASAEVVSSEKVGATRWYKVKLDGTGELATIRGEHLRRAG